MALNVDTGKPGAGRVIANGVGAATKVGFVQQESEGDCEKNKQRELEGERTPHIALAEPGEAVRIVVQRFVAQQNVGHTAIQAHGADGNDDRRQIQTRDQQAVKQTTQQTHSQPDGHQQRRIHPRRRAEAHHR